MLENLSMISLEPAISLAQSSTVASDQNCSLSLWVMEWAAISWPMLCMNWTAE